jgi:predicted nucleic acid-binding protein
MKAVRKPRFGTAGWGGRPRLPPTRRVQIGAGATARRHGLTIVTGNDRDFRRPGLRVLNPFQDVL